MIEDDKSDIFLLRRALEAQCDSIQLEIAVDGEKALEIILAAKSTECSRPDLILLDLHLPKYDGLEVLRAIREDPGFRHSPVVIVTNGASPQEAAEIRGMGAACRLKPNDLPEFEDLAADLIAICRQLQPTPSR